MSASIFLDNDDSSKNVGKASILDGIPAGSLKMTNEFNSASEESTTGEKLSEPYADRYSSRKVNGMDVIDLCKHWNLSFNEGSILKYLLRNKGQDISDMGKIIDFASREKDYLMNKVI